jgi:hypothetical protein
VHRILLNKIFDASHLIMFLMVNPSTWFLNHYNNYFIYRCYWCHCYCCCCCLYNNFENLTYRPYTTWCYYEEQQQQLIQDVGGSDEAEACQYNLYPLVKHY